MYVVAAQGRACLHPFPLLSVYKHYDMPLTLDGTQGNGLVPAVALSFSSYPAALFSDDDWLQTSAGLAVSGA